MSRDQYTFTNPAELYADAFKKVSSLAATYGGRRRDL